MTLNAPTSEYPLPATSAQGEAEAAAKLLEFIPRLAPPHAKLLIRIVAFNVGRGREQSALYALHHYISRADAVLVISALRAGSAA